MKLTLLILLQFVLIMPLLAQVDSSVVQDALYDRPFIIGSSTSSIAIGGYLEANTNYFAEDGVSEGFTMEMRRFNIFFYSTISRHIRFLAELEFEHGTEEIALETAQVDFEFNPALVLRAGILMAPIGAFNQNHDSPKWEFVERPLVATEIIPTTLSEVGFGLNGKFIFESLMLTYDAYLVNGLTDGIILNDQGRTFLKSGKTEQRLEEDNNDSPTFTGRLAFKFYQFGEIGFSYYGGVYNSYKVEGEKVDEKRNLSIMAIDFNTSLYGFDLRGEFVLNSIDVPNNIADIYGEGQWGGYLEAVYPVLRRPLFGFSHAVINASLRLEQVDYNTGTFASTGKEIFDDVKAVALALSFRPTADTVLRANYRYHWIRDALGNPTILSAGFQFGLATYF